MVREKETPEEIDAHRITHAYRQFASSVYTERKVRPAALRDIMYFPADVNKAKDGVKFKAILNKQALKGKQLLPYQRSQVRKDFRRHLLHLFKSLH